jgi:hypothetical protein
VSIPVGDEARWSLFCAKENGANDNPIRKRVMVEMKKEWIFFIT